MSMLHFSFSVLCPCTVGVLFEYLIYVMMLYDLSGVSLLVDIFSFSVTS